MRKVGGHRPLEGSRVGHLPGAKLRRRLEGDRRLEITVVLRPAGHTSGTVVSRRQRALAEAKLARREYLTLDKLGELNAPEPEHVKLVERFADRHGLNVLEVSDIRHDVILEGSVSAVEAAFDLVQHVYAHELGSYRAHDGPVQLPHEVAAVVLAVLGIDNVPHRGHPSLGWGAGPAETMTAPQVASHYDFPSPHAPEFGRIALMEFGGGYDTADLKAYFSGLGLSPPPLTDIAIRDGGGEYGRNEPLDGDTMRSVIAAWKRGDSFPDMIGAFGAAMGPFLSTVETTMDIEILGAVAVGTPVDVYFASPSVDAWRRAIFAAIGAPYFGSTLPDGHGIPTVMSMSWGASESMLGPMKLEAIHQAFVSATRLGVTPCCSTGDHGSRNSPVATEQANVNFPASSPAVLACGGTTIRAGEQGATDIVWNHRLNESHMASGGGMSGYFPAPPYQDSLPPESAGGTWTARDEPSFVGRRIPDVAANAAFESGVELIIAGESFIGGGTSASTPLWAALVAIVGDALGHPLGCPNPLLYRSPEGLRDVTVGDNDVADGAIRSYRAGPGWDPCTGWGVPDGVAFLEAFRDRG